MKCIKKGMIASFNILFVLVLLLPSAAATENFDIQFDQMKLSANLNRVPLETICNKISEESGIWFNGFLPSDKILLSFHFKDLSIEKALRRILTTTNHSLVFDQSEAVIGVHIFGNRTTSLEPGKVHHLEISKMVPNEEESETLDFETTEQSPTGDDTVELETIEEGKGGEELVENTVRHDLPMEVEKELANLQAMVKEALVED
jgi:hypothetical protein